MTEVLLLLVAILLSLACGAFVAAEFSLTTVERSELERAVERGERGAASALKAVRNLTFQLSGAQLGITVTNLVVGMLSEPSIAALIAGPLESLGVSASASSSLALVIGTGLSTVFLMVVGELVPRTGRSPHRWPWPSGWRHRSAGSVPCSGRSSRTSTTRRTTSCAVSAWSPPRSWPPRAAPRNWRRWPGTPPRPAPWSPTPRNCSYGP